MATRLVRNIAAAAVLLVPVHAQVKKLVFPIYKIVNKCTSQGRYNLAHYGMTHHYCWDKVYYSPQTAPAWMKDYFNQKQAEAERKSAELKAEFDRSTAEDAQRTAESRRKYEAESAAFRQRMSSQHMIGSSVRSTGSRTGGSSFVRPGTYSQASVRPQMQSVESTYSGVSASNRPTAKQLPLALFSEVTVGTSRADLVAKLGTPPGRVSGLAEAEESWTYVAEGGDFVKIKLKNDVVASIALPN